MGVALDADLKRVAKNQEVSSPSQHTCFPSLHVSHHWMLPIAWGHGCWLPAVGNRGNSQEEGSRAQGSPLGNEHYVVRKEKMFRIVVVDGTQKTNITILMTIVMTAESRCGDSWSAVVDVWIDGDVTFVPNVVRIDSHAKTMSSSLSFYLRDLIIRLAETDAFYMWLVRVKSKLHARDLFWRYGRLNHLGFNPDRQFKKNVHKKVASEQL